MVQTIWLGIPEIPTSLGFVKVLSDSVKCNPKLIAGLDVLASAGEPKSYPEVAVPLPLSWVPGAS